MSPRYPGSACQAFSVARSRGSGPIRAVVADGPSSAAGDPPAPVPLPLRDGTPSGSRLASSQTRRVPVAGRVSNRPVAQTVADPWGDDRHSTAPLTDGDRRPWRRRWSTRGTIRGPQPDGSLDAPSPRRRSAGGWRPLLQPARQRRRRGSAAASRRDRNVGGAVWLCSARSVTSAAVARTGQLSRRSVMTVD
jgi:hypothetical protein